VTRLSDVRIPHKIIAAFVIMLCCTIGLGVVSIHSLSQVSAKASNLQTGTLPATRALGDVARSAERFRSGQASELMAMTDSEVSHGKKVEQEALQLYEKSWAEYEPTVGSPDEKLLMEAIKRAWASYRAETEKVRDLLKSGQKPEAVAYFATVMSAGIKTIREAIQADEDFQLAEGNKAGEEGAEIAAAGFRWVLAVSSLTALLCFGLGWAMIRGLSTPITAMTNAMHQLANDVLDVDVPGVGRGDELGAMADAVQVFKDAAAEKLRIGEQRVAAAAEQAAVVAALGEGLERLSVGAVTFRIERDFALEYEKLRIDFNTAMERLQDTMKVVSARTTAIRLRTDEIASASDDLSKRTEQQAASVEKTATALDQITAAVRNAAEGSRHAREVVGAAKTKAEHSGQLVRQAVEAMGGIEKSSSQITQIIGVIDEIASRTDILALNAGVEAARAGDAGRGFAVIASGVRALAQRSAEAANKIKALISESSRQIEQGVGLVGQTGDALEQIIVQVAEINGIVTDIAGSAEEQAKGLDQVNTAIDQLDRVTQQNVAMVVESTAASQTLSQETEELAGLISQFDIGQGFDSTSARRPLKLPGPARAVPCSAAKTALKIVGGLARS
jgi:methyl-accepting chemotaxis protein